MLDELPSGVPAARCRWFRLCWWQNPFAFGGSVAVIEVLFFDGCPNHEGFVPRLRALLDSAGVDDPIHERVVETNAGARGAPFSRIADLRIDGVDVDTTAAQRTDYGLQCRLYPTQDGVRGTPPDEWILAALQRRQSALAAD
ncbi:hypothetical protein NLX85_17230 [Micromonospora sp. A3M-1-15]|uniref:DF family (seleno)protein n=1 Tax=Micromonospora sp. A3M-1-15 TaxID=2962035 RepID=UPI0020B7BDE5|nr:hypothetical protein [Micromonospora sp. A3M-1-15]MCP3785114.1 hypothetical protein [Micromonospora sp. A3M-1-15]